jgi:hypothetical protein
VENLYLAFNHGAALNPDVQEDDAGHLFDASNIDQFTVCTWWQYCNRLVVWLVVLTCDTQGEQDGDEYDDDDPYGDAEDDDDTQDGDQMDV